MLKYYCWIRESIEMFDKLFSFVKENQGKSFIILLTVFASIFTVIYLACTGNNYSQYSEVIMESGYANSINKACGVNLVYLLSFFGLIGYTIFYFLFKYKKQAEPKLLSKDLMPKIFVTILGIATVINHILWQYSDYTLATVFLFVLVLFFKDRENIFNGLILFLMNLFTIFACYRLFVLFGGNIELPYYLALAGAFGLSCLILKAKNKTLFLSKFILCEQVLLPFLLLIFIADKHKHYLDLLSTKFEIISIAPLPQVSIFIWGLIIAFFIEAIYLIKKHWGKEESLNTIMSFGACVSVMGYNLCKFLGNYAPLDTHHPYENIIGFHQIFQMGQVPFEQYVPVSGLYSILHGALFQFFGNGLITQFFTADNIFCLIVAILIVYLLNFHTDKVTRFLISISFLFVCLFPHYIHYDRVLFILPIMLLLSIPKLIEHKNLWLCAWVLTSLFHGLYYPVFGASVCIGFLPLGIYQVVTFIKSGEFAKEIKTLKFWLCWLITLVPVILSFKLLLGMYNQIKIMGSQSFPYEGISRFGQEFNYFFMYSFPSELKMASLYILTFVIPALLVWIAYAFTLKVVSNRKDNIKIASLVSSLVVIPLFAFSYTMLRLEEISIYVRAEAIIIAVIIMLVIFSQKYLKSEWTKYFLICFALCVTSISYSWGIANNGDKLKPYYNIWYFYDYVENDNTYKIGTGFIDSPILNKLPSVCSKFNKNTNYFALGPFATYYICDIGGVQLLESGTIRSQGVSQDLLSFITKYKPTIGFDVDSIRNYYLYNWLVTSGDYVWNKDLRQFLPNDGLYTKKEIDKLNSNIDLFYNPYESVFEKSTFINAEFIPVSIAHSFDNLISLFKTPNLNFSILNLDNQIHIDFEKEIDGNEADFVYLEFDNTNNEYNCVLHDQHMFNTLEGNCDLQKYFVQKNYNPDKFVKIEYIDNNNEKQSIYSYMGDGKLLIPLGSGNKWLLNKHSYIDIMITKGTNNNYEKINKIKAIKFLKLREIKTDE